MNDITVVVPAGAFGASEYDEPLDAALRAIAVAASPDPTGEWAEKYGTAFENDVFMMRPYCWCERDGCRWCNEDACGCPLDDVWYTWDGERVTWAEAEVRAAIPEYAWRAGAFGSPAYVEAAAAFEAAIAERDRHLETIWPARVHSCEPRGLMADRPQGDTWLPSQIAPNFWHKPSGFKVWWYKYIGRDTETLGDPPGDLLAQCLASLIKEQ